MSTANNAINNQIGTSTTATSLSHIRSASGVWQTFNDQTDLFGFYNRAGTPEGNIAANIGSRCIDTSTGDMYLKTTDTVNTGWVLVASGATFSVVNQVFGANGTYTPTTGMLYCFVRLVGGGGAGGGSPATAGGEHSVGGGGGAGGYSEEVIDAATIGASQAVTIGAAGVGASGASGGNGGTTSLGALISATGGVGGSASAAGGAVSAGGGAGGAGAGGGLNIQQGQGGVGWAIVANGILISGRGGSSVFGAGAYEVAFQGGATNGNAAGNYGAGGSGATSAAGVGAGTGGNGSAGFISIIEYVLS